MSNTSRKRKAGKVEMEVQEGTVAISNYLHFLILANVSHYKVTVPACSCCSVGTEAGPPEAANLDSGKCCWERTVPHRSNCDSLFPKGWAPVTSRICNASQPVTCPYLTPWLITFPAAPLPTMGSEGFQAGSHTGKVTLMAMCKYWQSTGRVKRDISPWERVLPGSICLSL